MKTMMDYISGAPDKIKENLSDSGWCENLAGFMKREKERLVIVASGSSCNAANCAKMFMQKTLDIETVSYTHLDVYKRQRNGD